MSNAGMLSPANEALTASDAASIAEPAVIGNAADPSLNIGGAAVRFDPLTGKPIVPVVVDAPVRRFDPLTGKEIVPVIAKPIARDDYGARMDRLEALIYTVIEKALGRDALPPEYHALTPPEKIEFHAVTTGLAVATPARAN
jgi:hypothetical protein